MFSIEYLHSDLQLRTAVEEFIAAWHQDDKEIEVYTSGSTGKPKLIRLQKIHMQQSARMTAGFLGLKRGQTALLCLSPETIAGKMMIVRAMEYEMRLIVGLVNANPLENLSEKIDFAAMVPMQVETSLELNLNRLRQIGCLIIGGAPISSRLNKALLELPGKIYHTFGMTETISHVAMRRITEDNESYVPLAGVKLFEENGQLIIDAPELGVHNLRTNDEIELTSEGFIWLGRRDFVVNSGGIKLHPEMIEAKLAPHIDRPFFVAGLSDERLGEALALYIEGEAFDLEAVNMSSFLLKYEVPRHCFFLPHFAYTPSGKILRGETLKRVRNGAQ